MPDKKLYRYVCLVLGFTECLGPSAISRCQPTFRTSDLVIWGKGLFRIEFSCHQNYLFSLIDTWMNHFNEVICPHPCVLNLPARREFHVVHRKLHVGSPSLVGFIEWLNEHCV